MRALGLPTPPFAGHEGPCGCLEIAGAPQKTLTLSSDPSAEGMHPDTPVPSSRPRCLWSRSMWHSQEEVAPRRALWMHPAPDFGVCKGKGEVGKLTAGAAYVLLGLGCLGGARGLGDKQETTGTHSSTH